MTTLDEVKRVAKSGNSHLFFQKHFDQIARELEDGEVLLEVLAVLKLWTADGHLPAKSQLILTNRRVIVLTFSGGNGISQDANFWPIKLSDVAVITPIVKTGFKVQVMNGTILNVQGRGQLSKKYTRRFHTKMGELITDGSQEGDASH